MHALLVLIFLQIVSESFPVSSSGHVALALLYVAHYVAQDYQVIAQLFQNDTFMFLLHIPTIIIVALFFRSTWWPLLKTINRRWRLVMKLIGYALVADVITAFMYVGIKLFAPSFPLCLGFLCTAAFLMSLRWAPSVFKKLDLSDAIILGLAQGVALFPGISRLATVYCSCRWLGLNHSKSFGVSWMLQFPLMVAAAGLAMIKEVSCPTIIWSQLSLPLIGIATVLGYVAFWITNRASRANLFWLFGIYMMVPIVICLLIAH